MIKITNIFVFFFICAVMPMSAQNTSQKTADQSAALVSALMGETPIIDDLQELCDQYGGRVTGTPANEASVEWGLEKFEKAGVNVQKEGFEMPTLWIENATTAEITGATNFTPKVVALSFSAPTSKEGLKSNLLDGGFGSKEDFAKLGANAKGKFVIVETEVLYDLDGLFKEYEDAARIEENALVAGVGGIVYMSSRPRRLLYRHNASKGVDNTLPLMVMGREDASRCLRLLRGGKTLDIHAFIDLNLGGKYTCHNVIAEIPGTDLKDEVIIIGSHLDSWGLGTGANDNGCNVALMIDIARQMKRLNIQPRRTIRFALWNGEEQGFFGSWGYTQSHSKELDQHKMALSVDIGSGPIIGFFTNGREEIVAVSDKVLENVKDLGPFLNINIPIVGTDNFDFMLEGIPNLVANHKPATYAQNYHAESDTFDKVDLKSLKENAAIVAALVLGYANYEDDSAQLKRQSRAEIDGLIEATKMEIQMRMFNVWDPWVKGLRGRGLKE